MIDENTNESSSSPRYYVGWLHLTLLLTKKLSTPFLVVGCFAVANVSNAQAEGGPSSVSDLKFYWLNFIVYIAILVFLLRGAISSGWSSRRERIKHTVTTATRELESAEADVKAVEQRTRTLEADQRKAKDEILKQGDAEASSIASAARDRAARLRTQAEELLKGEGRAAEAAYRDELVNKALTLVRGRFERGEFSSKEQEYRDAALGRAGRLVQ